MIMNGEPIPGIRKIPDKLNDGKESESVLARREGSGKKPWER